ncbi:MAG: cbb3-type cytochrome oxidase assembly protein CcoS [Granulosicoccus sp.]
MNYLFLVPISLLLAVTALFVFLWTLNSDQYDDLDGAAERILIDDDVPITRDRPSADNTKLY